MKYYEIISVVINGIIALTGFSAIGLYLLQQYTKKHVAATLIITQIDEIEENIKALRNEKTLNEITIYNTKRILRRNYWEENRHLLSRQLGENNVKILDEFYSQAEEIEKSKQMISHAVTITWDNKDLVYQTKLAEEICSTGTFDIKNSRLNLFDKFGTAFSPQLPMDMIKRDLSNYQSISGTVAYDKLRSISNHS